MDPTHLLHFETSGRPPYLTDEGVELVDSVVQAMDRVGLPCTATQVSQVVRKTRAYITGIDDIEKVSPPSRKTLQRIQKRLSPRERTLRVGEAIRKERSKEELLADTYSKLRELYHDHGFRPEDMYVRTARPPLPSS